MQFEDSPLILTTYTSTCKGSYIFKLVSANFLPFGPIIIEQIVINRKSLQKLTLQSPYLRAKWGFKYDMAINGLTVFKKTQIPSSFVRAVKLCLSHEECERRLLCRTRMPNLHGQSDLIQGLIFETP